MREVKFILPIQTSPHHDKGHHFARAALLDAFGGFTTYDSQGGWRNGAGKMILEPGITYVVAIEGRGALSQFPRFREIVLQAGRMAEQEAVYIVGPTGDAEIVSLVDVGKEVIRGEAKAEPRRPQVGDFWETADGSKVYVDRGIASNNSLLVKFVTCTSDHRHEDYAVNTDGTYIRLDGSTHPLSLKRFIGR